MSDTLQKLATVLELRKSADPKNSYVAGLYAAGLDAILKKVGEESAETIIAAKDGDAGQIIHEIADLWFHTMVLLKQQNLEPLQILEELEQRFGLSGLEEKRSRSER